MIRQVIIGKSKIHGKGVFALRDFKRGEVVIEWHPKIIAKTKLKRLTEKQKTYAHRSGDKYYLMQSPEKFVNHSLAPNTRICNGTDVAIRAIKKGEEITTRYNKEYLTFV